MLQNQEIIEASLVEEETKILSRLAVIKNLKEKAVQEESELKQKLAVEVEKDNKDLELQRQKAPEPVKPVVNEERLRELEKEKEINNEKAKNQLIETHKELDAIFSDAKIGRREFFGTTAGVIAGATTIGTAITAINTLSNKKTTKPESKEPKNLNIENEQNKKEFGKLLEHMDVDLYKNVLRDDGRLVYLHRLTDKKEQNEHPGFWIMIDKKTSTMFLMNEGKLVRKGPVLEGQTLGDALNDWDYGGERLTTPPAYTVLSNENIAPMYVKQYGNDLWRIESQIEGRKPIFMHGLLPEDMQKELSALQTESSKDNRMSHGCIRNPNIKEDQKHFVSGVTRIAILAEEGTHFLNPKTGTLEQADEKKLKQEVQEYIDKYK